MCHGVGGAPRQHPVLLADRWEPLAGHRFLLLRGCTIVGPAPKSLLTRKHPAYLMHASRTRTQVYGLHLRVGVPGEVEEAHNAPGPLHWTWESWVRAPPSPTWATLVILVPSLAGLPADVDTPEQSGVLPALHHQASLCSAVLQPSCPGLSKPVTGRATPAVGQGSQLLRDLSCLEGAVIMLPTRACAPRPATTVLEHLSQRLLTPGTRVTQRYSPSQEPVGEKRLAALGE